MADVLRVLAVSRSSGALEVRGLRSGTFFLHDGDITYAEALGVPPAEEFDPADPRLRATIQSSIVEVGLNLLAEENIEGERPLFRPGRRHWSGRAIRIEVESLLAEIAQQLKNFTKLGVEPDDEVQLCGLPPGRTVVLNRQQWALTAEMFGPQTARSLARRSGASLSATIETVASLVRAGLVRRGVPASVVPAPPTTPIPTDPLPTGPFPLGHLLRVHRRHRDHLHLRPGSRPPGKFRVLRTGPRRGAHRSRTGSQSRTGLQNRTGSQSRTGLQNRTGWLQFGLRTRIRLNRTGVRTRTGPGRSNHCPTGFVVPHPCRTGRR